jgi:hypothetical protein
MVRRTYRRCNRQTITADRARARLEQIIELLQALIAGQEVPRINGAAGIGKSRLKATLIDRAVTQHVIVAQGMCHSSTQQTSYQPWRQILKALFAADHEAPVAPNAAQELAQLEQSVADLDGRWLDRLPLLSELLGTSIPDTTTTRALEAQQRQAMLFDFVLDLLRAWAAHQPRVIVLEDIQWLDEASQQLTLALARALADTPILLAVVHRDDRGVNRQISGPLPRDRFGSSSEARCDRDSRAGARSILVVDRSTPHAGQSLVHRAAGRSAGGFRPADSIGGWPLVAGQSTLDDTAERRLCGET